MKKIFYILSIIVLLSLLLFYISYDYSWESNTIAKQGNEWKVYYKTREIEILKVWRWFNAPATTLFFVNTSKMGKIDGSLFYGYEMSISRDSEGFNEYGGIRLIDTVNKETTLVDSNEDYGFFERNQLNKLTWVKYGKRDATAYLLAYIKENKNIH